MTFLFSRPGLRDACGTKPDTSSQHEIFMYVWPITKNYYTCEALCRVLDLKFKNVVNCHLGSLLSGQIHIQKIVHFQFLVQATPP